MCAADVRRQRVSRMRGFRHWKWHLDEVYVKINGEMHYLWRAVDKEGEILESDEGQGGSICRLPYQGISRNAASIARIRASVSACPGTGV